MLTRVLKDFDIEQIAKSGQCFRLERTGGNRWRLIAHKRKLNICRRSHDEYEFDCSEKDFQDVWYNYFDFETDYSTIKDKIRATGDPFLIAATQYGWGLRILRQDLWETTVSFIISQRNNIPRITRIIKRLCGPFGGEFPSPTLLRTYSENDFKKLGLGYRSKYLVDIVKSALNGELDYQTFEDMNLAESLQYLQKFNGIGSKVANCIALFSLHKIEAFPIDVWIKRIIDEKYNGSFPMRQFEGFAGIVQQYMFFYERSQYARLLGK